MYKENYIHSDCSNVLYFLSPLSIETLCQGIDISETNMRNMPFLYLLRAGSPAPHVKDLRVTLKGKLMEGSKN